MKAPFSSLNLFQTASYYLTTLRVRIYFNVDNSEDCCYFTDGNAEDCYFNDDNFEKGCYFNGDNEEVATLPSPRRP